LIIDELADLCPGKGRSFLKDQHRISQLIAYNHRKFRRHHIRLLGASHYFRDLTVPVRQRFDCYVIKKNYPNEKEVPFTLQKYAHLFPKLEVNELIYLDSKKNFNRFTLPMLIKPIPHNDIIYEGSVDDLFRDSEKAKGEERLWRENALQLLILATEKYGVSAREVAQLWHISPSRVRAMKSEYKQGRYLPP